MSDDKRRFKATINQKDYLIVGPGSDQHMATVTKLLNDQLNEIFKQNPNLSAEDAAILIAFNAISDEVNYK